MYLSLHNFRKIIKSNKSAQGSLIAIVLGSVLLATIVASGTSWYLTMRNNLGDTEEKLEAQTIAQSEWERLSHMSLDELEANRETFKIPYSAGTGSQFTISVNLGQKGTFNNGTCGGVSGGYANCFQNTTITVYQDGNRVFTTRTLPLMAGDYTRKEIDSLLASMKNDYISRDNALKNDYTSKINNEATARANKDTDLQKQINNLSAKFGEYYKKSEIDKLFEEKSGFALNVSQQQSICSGSYYTSNCSLVAPKSGFAHISTSYRETDGTCGYSCDMAHVYINGAEISLVGNAITVPVEKGQTITIKNGLKVGISGIFIPLK